jgi:hypothetical protein
MKNQTLILLGGGALLAYYFWKKSQAAQSAGAAAVITPGAGAPIVNITPVPQSNTGVAGQLTVPQVVTDWVGTMDVANRNQFYAQLKVMTQADINGLQDIIVNDWEGTGIATPAQRAFWDTWRVKYHILDGTY